MTHHDEAGVRSRRRGLSLIEVLVALSLAVGIAGTALVRYGAMLSSWRLNAAARQVVMDLKLTRARAISADADHRLRFTDHATSYQRQRKLPSGAYVDDGVAIPLPVEVEVVGCNALGSGITFRPRGHASTFGTITLANAEGGQRRVVVDIVGRMRVE